MCDDPATTYLRNLGYAVVRLPKSDILPLQLLSSSGGNLIRLGNVTDVLIAKSGTVAPSISINNVAPNNVNGQKSGDLGIGVAVKILSGALSALGAGQIGLDAQYKHAASAQFTFADVLEDHVDIAKLDLYLGQCDLNHQAVNSERLLEDDQIFVITSTIKSNKFTVEAKNSEGTSLAVDVPVIQQIVGANVKVSSTGAANATVSYEGAIALVFGFQAVRLRYSHGRYTAMDLPGPDTQPMMLTGTDSGHRVALGPTRFVPQSKLYRFDS